MLFYKVYLYLLFSNIANIGKQSLELSNASQKKGTYLLVQTFSLVLPFLSILR